MILAIVWKEWREQRSIALAIMAFGALALVLTGQFAEPVTGQSILDAAGPRELMAPALAYLAGIVCGAILFADEKEVGTLEFLDSMPSRRRSLWLGKVVFGIGLTCLQCLLFAGLASALECGLPRVSIRAFAIVMVLIGLLAFGWGAFGGALSRSTLGAVFLGAVSSFVVGIALAIPLAVLFGLRLFGRDTGIPVLLYYCLWLGLGLLISARVFSAADRLRHRRLVSTKVRRGSRGFSPKPVRRSPIGLAALSWLTIRQATLIAMGACSAGVLVGAVMLLPDSHPVLLWPGATLAIGVFAGVTVLGEEQTRSVARFWAERRLPLGRMWLTKVAGHLLIAAIAAMLVFLPLFAASPNLPFRSRLLAQTELGVRAELTRFIWLPLFYGFAFGHLAGMIFRKAIVAALAAVVSAATFVALIAPSLFGGGAAAWQVWSPALIVLGTARLLLYPWATERSMSAGPVLRAIGGTSLAAIVLAAGLAYRVYEIPDTPDRLAESGYEARLPSFETNHAGRALKGAVSLFRRSSDDAYAFYPSTNRNGPIASSPSRMNVPSNIPAPAEDTDPLERVARFGWSEDSNRLKDWLDKVVPENGSWPAMLNELVGKPIGVFEDPRDLDYFSTDTSSRDLREMIVALLARSFQRQAEGDSASYVRFLPGALAALRTARFMGGWRTPEFAMQSEEILLHGLSDWLAALEGRADLIRTALELLARHEREMPLGNEDAYWAERVILRNTFQRIGTWLSDQIERKPAAGNHSPQVEAEQELVSVAWAVPWERIRRERILRVYSNRDQKVNPAWLSGLHLRAMWRPDRVERLAKRDERGLTLRRAVQIQLAIRLYCLERGEPVRDIRQLVPKYLPAIPEDPYSGKPFAYRLSTAEEIGVDFGGRRPPPAEVGSPMTTTVIFGNSTPQPGIAVVENTGIVWSTGPDGENNGGRRTPPRGSFPGQGQDWVFVVPPPRNGRP